MNRTIRLKALTYNIHKGFNWNNVEFVLHGIRELIRREDPDLVFLQEVIGQHEIHSVKVKDWPISTQLEFLADEVWTHFAYGKNAVYDAGHHGNAILSRYPIRSWDNIDISNHQLERRGLLHAEIEIPEMPKPLHAICVHLDLLESGRRRQLQRLTERIHQAVPDDSPLIVAGDFNDWRRRATRILRRGLALEDAFRKLHGREERTFPSRLPVLPLDRIYYRGPEATEARAITTAESRQLSDHRPIYAVFEFKPG